MLRLATTVSVACLTLASGCRPGEDAASRPSGLTVPRAEAWPDGIIPVCWTTPGYAYEKSLYQQVVTREYNGRTNVRFTEWQECGTNSYGKLRVEIDPGAVPNMPEGRDQAARFVGQMFDRTIASPELDECLYSESARQICLNNIALHEFGHAAGLVHEQERPDSSCSLHRGWPHAGQIPVGGYDGRSVMDACNPSYFGELMALSEGDVAAIDSLYPRAPDGEASGSVWMSGSGYQQAYLPQPAVGSVVVVDFAPGCHGPFTGNLYVNGWAETFTCDNCPAFPENTTGPWIFTLGRTMTVSSVGAHLGDGSCSYRATVRPY